MSLTTGDVYRPGIPIPSIPRAELSVRVVTIWHRGKTGINRLLGNAPPELCTTREPTHPFPYEIDEMIIAHLIDDVPTLKACSLTCRSWYIIAAPHVYRTLILGRGYGHGRLKSLSKLCRRGLIPLVQEILVEWGNWFTPEAFDRRSLRHFAAFANVHTLGLHNVDIYRFSPHIERYFGLFLPTLRSIVLSYPCCTPRQLSHFLSLFSNLDDIRIRGLLTDSFNPVVPDATPVPFSTLKLRGRLALATFSYVETWTHLIASCGGLRFHRMDLCGSVPCMPFLLEACTETLETLRLHPGDLRASRGLDLSRLKALRSLQLDASVHRYCNTGLLLVLSREVFSTITSPIFSELVIVRSGKWTHNIAYDVRLAQTLQMMHKVRPFKLVFLFEGPYSSGPVDRRREMMEAVDDAVSKGFLDFLDSPPTVRITAPSRYYDWKISEFD